MDGFKPMYDLASYDNLIVGELELIALILGVKFSSSKLMTLLLNSLGEFVMTK